MIDFSELTIIIPTLNEGKNITKLIKSIKRKYKNVTIIVSDDGSTDSTKNEVLGLSKNKKLIFLDRKSKKVHGLTASVMDAAMITKTKFIIVMDGDMQHPYEKIAEITKNLGTHEIVVAVRKHVKNWGVHRKIISKSASSLAYAALKIRGKKIPNDVMSGFFGIKTSLFKGIIIKNRSRFVGKGYKVLLDILRVVNKDATLGEVYYDTFHEREQGKSKFKLHHISNTLESILR
jgi:dolichol-phosphate mannosyltransferase